MYSLLTVHLTETNSCLCCCQRILLNSTFNTRYAISYLHLAQLAIETMLYRHLRYIIIFSKGNIYIYIYIYIYLEIDKKGTADQFYMHIYLTLILIMLFNISRL